MGTGRDHFILLVKDFSYFIFNINVNNSENDKVLGNENYLVWIGSFIKHQIIEIPIINYLREPNFELVKHNLLVDIVLSYIKKGIVIPENSKEVGV